MKVQWQVRISLFPGTSFRTWSAVDQPVPKKDELGVLGQRTLGIDRVGERGGNSLLCIDQPLKHRCVQPAHVAPLQRSRLQRAGLEERLRSQRQFFRANLLVYFRAGHPTLLL
ncbi:MAG: hypothetical protein RID62_11565 [Roseovarius sp.]|uniref:hypothetical protein n=1 Tax=Roseovarius sp. TaxID=1486281 RepID=UPI0032EC791E